MIVIIAGMYRSGSTFTFNIAREILQGAVDVLSANSVTAAELVRAQQRHLVIKSHLPDDALVEMINSGQAVCVRTYRKPEEAVASWIDTFGYSFEDSVKAIRGWMDRHHSAHCDALNIPYEMIEERPLSAILMIQYYLFGRINRPQARELNARYNKAQIKQRCDAMVDNADNVNIGFSYYNPETFFHRRHVSSVTKRTVSNTLNATQIAEVREAFANYVDADGEYKPTYAQKRERSTSPIKSTAIDRPTERTDAVNSY